MDFSDPNVSEENLSINEEKGKVTVAVRIRPFNLREINKSENKVFKVDKNQIELLNPLGLRNEISKPRLFKYDYCLSGIDEAHSDFADQEKVYNSVGKPLLEPIFNGFNASILAYGQTGSGKSYTMMGTPNDEGVTPRLCKEIFEKAEKMQEGASDYSTKIEVSYLEIYMERVRDLLNPNNTNLRVREHAIYGPFCENLTSVAVRSYDEVKKLMNEGNAVRTVAATNMNSESSRSHAIFTIIFTQIQSISNKEDDDINTISVERQSKINLVDLAGSERNDSTGATGKRLREAGNINQSLSTLGRVISALASRSSAFEEGSRKSLSTNRESGSGKKLIEIVPYRDSILTWLLKESLGGNAKTTMICTVSPSSGNYEETLSTLRYADNAKRIVTKPVVNEDSNTKLIRQLRSEVEELRRLLLSKENRVAPNPSLNEICNTTVDDEKNLEVIRLREEMEITSLSLSRQLNEKQNLIEKLTQTWEEKLAQARETAELRSIHLQNAGVSCSNEEMPNVPYLLNLNEDPSLSEKLITRLQEGITRLGREPDIENELFFTSALCGMLNYVRFDGINILDIHCDIHNVKGVISLHPLNPEGPCFVNGVRVTSPIVLTQGCRIVLGSSNIYRFTNPSEVKHKEKLITSEENEYNWQNALNEVTSSGEKLKSQLDKILSQCEKSNGDAKNDMEREMKLFRKDQTERILKLQRVYETRVGELGKEGAKDLRAAIVQETETLRIAEERLSMAIRLSSKKKMEYQDMQLCLLRTLPRVEEANVLSKYLKANIHMKVHLVTTVQPPSQSLTMSVLTLPPSDALRALIKVEVAVKVINDHNKESFKLWSLESFNDRLALMRENYAAMKSHVNVNMHSLEDPFRDIPSPTLVGRGSVNLCALGHLLSIEITTPILDFKGKKVGTLCVELVPKLEGGGNLYPNAVSDPSVLLGLSMGVTLIIKGLYDLPLKYQQSPFITFSWYDDLDPFSLDSDECISLPLTMELGSVEITKEFLSHLEHSVVTFEIWSNSSDDDIFADDASISSPHRTRGSSVASSTVGSYISDDEFNDERSIISRTSINKKDMAKSRPSYVSPQRNKSMLSNSGHLIHSPSRPSPIIRSSPSKVRNLSKNTEPIVLKDNSETESHLQQLIYKLFINIDIEEIDMKKAVFLPAQITSDGTFRLQQGKTRRWKINITQIDNNPFFLEDVKIFQLSFSSDKERGINKVFDLTFDTIERDSIHRTLTACVQWNKIGDATSILSRIEDAESVGFIFPVKVILHLSSIKSPSLIKVEKTVRLKVHPEAFKLASEIKKITEGNLHSRVDSTGTWLDVTFHLSENGNNEIISILQGHAEGLCHLEAVLHMEYMRQKIISDSKLRSALFSTPSENSFTTPSRSLNNSKRSRSLSTPLQRSSAAAMWDLSSPVGICVQTLLKEKNMFEENDEKEIDSSFNSPDIGQVKIARSMNFNEKVGFLEKQGRRTKQWKRKWCVLRRPLLYIYDHHGENEKVNKIIDLTSSRSESVRIIGAPFAFRIFLLNAKVYVFQSSSEKESESWLEALNPLFVDSKNSFNVKAIK